jgi:hypothetical protein
VAARRGVEVARGAAVDVARERAAVAVALGGRVAWERAPAAAGWINGGTVANATANSSISLKTFFLEIKKGLRMRLNFSLERPLSRLREASRKAQRLYRL